MTGFGLLRGDIDGTEDSDWRVVSVPMTGFGLLRPTEAVLLKHPFQGFSPDDGIWFAAALVADRQNVVYQDGFSPDDGIWFAAAFCTCECR